MQDMATEGREASRDGLVVPDVRMKAGQGGEAGALPGRHRTPAGGQGAEDTHGLQDHGLPAGVGARDDQARAAGLQGQVQGHDVMGQGLQAQGLPHGGEQHGVAGLHQAEAALLGVCSQVRQQAPAEGAPAQQGDGLVRLGLQGLPADEVFPPGPQVRQQLPQEGLHGLGVVAVGFHKGVVEGDGLQGLHEHRGPAAAAVQHQTRHEAPPLLAHR